jgi:site-specific recombinase XerD
MKTKLLVSFLARKAMTKKTGLAPIYCKLRYDGTTTQFNTNIDVPCMNWDSRRTRVIGDNKKALNLQLEHIRVALLEKYDALIKTNAVITAKTIVDFYKNDSIIMDTLLNVFAKHNKDMQMLIGKQYKYGSFKNYKTTLKHITIYINAKYNAKDILLSKINYDFVYNFSQYLLMKTKCNNNGMMKHIQRFKKVFNFCIKNKYILHNPLNEFRVSFKRTNRVYLLQSELKTLHDIKLSDSLNRIRDVFLFACYTGLSYTDISKLSAQNIKKGDDGFTWVYITRNKTNIPSNIPLLPHALFLMELYAIKSNGKTLFPIISNQKINKGLKAISLMCNFNKKLTFHSARHTFATTVTLTNGVPIESVSKMLGHNNIKTTQIYARVIDSKVSQDMLILRQKFI